MYINICNQLFDEADIRNICITNTQVLIDTETEYYTLRYHSKEDIVQAEEWLEFRTITRSELSSAVDKIIMTCNHFINHYDQCSGCPLKKTHGCVFTTIPLNWRETNV